MIPRPQGAVCMGVYGEEISPVLGVFQGPILSGERDVLWDICECLPPSSKRPFGTNLRVGSPKQSHAGLCGPKADNIVLAGQDITYFPKWHP